MVQKRSILRVPPFKRSLKVIGTDTDRSATHDLLLVFYCKETGSASYSINSIFSAYFVLKFPHKLNIQSRYDHSFTQHRHWTDRRTDEQNWYKNIALCMHCMLMRDKTIESCSIRVARAESNRLELQPENTLRSRYTTSNGCGVLPSWFASTHCQRRSISSSGLSPR